MKNQFIIEIEKNNTMIHQGEIFDHCSIGGQKNNFYQSRGLDENEILIREIGGLYNFVTVSDQWKLNGKDVVPQKYYPLKSKNKLTMGIYKINIKKVVNDSAGGLEIDKPKYDIKDLIGSTPKNELQTDFYADKSTSKKTFRNYVHIKRLGFFAGISSFIFNLSIFYTLTWSVSPKLQQSAEFSLIVKDFKEIIISTLFKISPKFINDDRINIFSSLFSRINILEDAAFSLDQMTFKILIGMILFLSLKLLIIFLLGNPIQYFIMGVNNQGSFFGKRVKGFVYEILSIILLPLSIYNLGGILPLKSLPAKISGINFYQSSKSLKYLGPILLIICSIVLLNINIISMIIDNPKKFEKIKLAHSSKNIISNIEIIELGSTKFKIPPLPDINIKRKDRNGLELFQITSSLFKRSVAIKEIKGPFLSWENNIAVGNPTAFITHPVHALKNMNLAIPDGNTKELKKERLDQINSIINLNQSTLLNTSAHYGFFTLGLSTIREEFLKIFDNQANLKYFWTIEGELFIAQSKRLLVTHPLAPDKNTIEVIFVNNKDQRIFVRELKKIHRGLPPSPRTDGFFQQIAQRAKSINLRKIYNNIGNLNNFKSLSDMKEKIKIIQGRQKELTDQLNEATKSVEEEEEEEKTGN